MGVTTSKTSTTTEQKIDFVFIAKQASLLVNENHLAKFLKLYLEGFGEYTYTQY